MASFAVVVDGNGVQLLTSKTLGDALREAGKRRLTLVALESDDKEMKDKATIFGQQLKKERREEER